MKSLGLSKIVCFFSLIVILFISQSFYGDPNQPIDPDSLKKQTWYDFQQRVPFPYTIPLPKPNRSVIDGTYTKIELKDTPPIHCRRCPDYAPEGGIWKWRLDQGVFRIFHESTGWKGIGTAIVTSDLLAEIPAGQLVLANDPVCPEIIGVYRYKLEEGKLYLSVIDDPCAARMRALNLTGLPWSSCQAPNREAAITEHWPVPAGCE